MRKVGLKTKSLVLDIGAGFGREALWFASSGFNMVALDIDRELCRVIQENFKIGKFQDTNAVTVRADGHNLPFKEDLFDLVFCKAVLHHGVDIPQMTVEIHRVLRENGALTVVDEPNKLNPLWHLAKFLTRSLHFKSYILGPGEFIRKDRDEPLSVREINTFCHWQLAEYLRQAGFDRVRSGCMWLPYVTANRTYFKLWLMLEGLVEKTFIPYIFGQVFVVGSKGNAIMCQRTLKFGPK
jgi:ubiquinone/menaquinone biosynthesis C-methylase UbiE